ncbi:MAG: hypothetical protein K9W43_13695 [Candidatus Thorarchaeota archaeon]|nr:hypothetical protein [Candidatus Thorarchaeota archaeon]
MDRIAIIGMCDKDYVDEILHGIETRTVSTTVEWTNTINDGMKKALDFSIHRYGYARLFFYETKKSGGGGIRIAAHFDSYKDIMLPNCYGRKP